MKLFKQTKIASMLVITIVATGIFITLLSGVISLGLLQVKLNKTKIAKSQALHIAEAGINYYKWVLYHDEDDYCNKEQCKPSPEYGPYGPYSFFDQSRELNGQYQLYIFPPTDDSGIIKIKSVGWVDEYPNIKRTIEVELGQFSMASYLLLSNKDVRITNGTEATGVIHSNGGVRFDGMSNSLVSSALSEYDDPSHEGGNEFGVHTHKTTIDPLPPTSVPNRSDVFAGGRFFPAQTINMGSLDSYVADMYTRAQNGGLVLDFSGAYGYYIEFMPSANPKMKIYRVTSITSPCKTCLVQGACLVWKKGVCQSYACAQWSESISTYDINNTDRIPGGPNNSQYEVPENGIIFVKDNVWVDALPHVNGTQVTVLAFRDPFDTGNADIIINGGSSYKEGSTSVIGLIAQDDILLPFGSAGDLEIDAAMIAVKGKIGREDYPSYCGSGYTKSNLKIFGSMAMPGTDTTSMYGFSYFNNSGVLTSGYQTVDLEYDGSLKLNPPPHFPLTGEYNFLSWREN